MIKVLRRPVESALRPVVVVVDQPGQISPSSRLRVQMACSTASRTSRVVIDVPAR